MSLTQETARVLLVDDDLSFLDRAAEALHPFTYVRTARNADQGLSTVAIWKPDVILLDMLLEDLDGFTFLEQLRKMKINQLPFILCTTDGYGAHTRIRPLPNWRVGTLVRSSTTQQLRSAVLEAINCQGVGLGRQQMLT